MGICPPEILKISKTKAALLSRLGLAFHLAWLGFGKLAEAAVNEPKRALLSPLFFVLSKLKKRVLEITRFFIFFTRGGGHLFLERAQKNPHAPRASRASLANVLLAAPPRFARQLAARRLTSSEPRCCCLSRTHPRICVRIPLTIVFGRNHNYPRSCAPLIKKMKNL